MKMIKKVINNVRYAYHRLWREYHLTKAIRCLGTMDEEVWNKHTKAALKHMKSNLKIPI